MAEFRKNHPILYCVIAAALSLGAMMLLDWLWGLGVDAGVLSGIDAAVPNLDGMLVKLVPDAALAQTLALVMPMVFGVLIGCIALFLLRKGKICQVWEAWASVVEAPAGEL